MLHNRLAKLREERQNGEHGFTLIELLVVVVIIGILIAIAIPLYLNYRKGANDKSAQSDVRGAVSALEQCNSDNGSYPAGSGASTALAITASGTSLTGCSQKITLSSGTTLNYYADTSAPNSYEITGNNSNGSGKWYCYNSANGGSVKSVSADGANAC